MKFFYLIISLFHLSGIAAQKSLISDTSYRKWTSLENGELSDDGNYAYYRIVNNYLSENKFIITSTDGKWHKEIMGFSQPNFSSNSKYLFGIMQPGSLLKYLLKSDSIVLISDCKSYELFVSQNNEWLLYINSNNELTVNNIVSNKNYTIQNVKNYFINKKGGSLIVQISTSKNDQYEWILIEISSGKSKVIFHGENAANFIFDNFEKKVAFTSIQNNTNGIWLYKNDFTSAKMLVDDNNQNFYPNYRIGTDICWRFSRTGEHLFFNITNADVAEQGKVKSPSIWSFKDAYLFSEMKNEGEAAKRKGEGLTSLNINNSKVVRLLHGHQREKIIPNSVGDVVLVESSFGALDEVSWNEYSKIDYSLCISGTSEMISIKKNCDSPITQIELSPDNSFLIYFDPQLSKYLSFNIETRATKIVSGLLSDELYEYSPIFPHNGQLGGIAAWANKKSSVIIQGKYDLWELDLTGRFEPRNITNWEGAKKKIALSLVQYNEGKIIDPNTNQFVGGFDFSTKTFTIYSINFSKKSLRRLYHTSDFVSTPYTVIANFMKAKRSNKFMFKFGNVSNTPNYVYTHDFKTFTCISEVYPEKKYNWLTSELISYSDNVGKLHQGIIYKPENFNFNLKYPVIFNYYVSKSNLCNQYITPEPESDGINIPLLVSNGYIVIVPDMYINKRTPGESALTSLLAVSDYVSKFEWIDTTKMAVSGHSFGGFETLYIITHTNKFAAAITGAATSNLVQNYNDLWGNGFSKQNYVKHAYKMEFGLDSIPEIYFKNSPVVFVKNMNTPLLMMHNDDDNSVPVNQGKQFFIQARSLKKRVWLIQYEGEKHTLIDETNKLDFQNKILDFFNFYLKGQTQPKWMNIYIH
jgi:dienelactone hydrolase